MPSLPPIRLLHVTRERGNDARYGIGKSLAPVVAALRVQGYQVDIHDEMVSNTLLPRGLLPHLGRLLWRLVQKYYVPSGPEQTRAEWILGMVEERVRISWTAAQRAARGGYTHVHCHDPILAWLYARFSRMVSWSGLPARWGVTAHGYGMFVQNRVGLSIPPRLLHDLQRWERWVTKYADWLCAPSEAGLRQLQLDLAASKGVLQPATTLPPLPPHWHAVPHPRPPLHLPPSATARQQLGLQPEDWLVLGVGQLIPMKRFDAVITAVARLPVTATRRPMLLLLGEGDTVPLRMQATTLGLADRLRIEITDNIGIYLAAADIYVSASSTESFGMANCEALAAGLPAICTAVGAVPAVVKEAAWLIDDSVSSEVLADRLAAALTVLATDAGRYSALAAAALAWGERWPKPEAVAESMKQIYRGTC